MKFLCSFIFAFSLIIPLGVGQADTGNKKPQSPSIKKITPQKPISTSNPQPKKTHKELWPRTFVPTEKITADSAVSFPADI